MKKTYIRRLGWQQTAQPPNDQASGDDAVELAFTLYATAVQGDELDLAVQKIERLPGVQQAFWTAGEGR